MITSTDPDKYFNPLNPEHIADPDELMHASRIGCPVGRVSDVLYTVNTDAAVRAIFNDPQRFSSRGNFSLGAEDVKIPVRVINVEDPPRHTELRARLLKDFAPVRLRKLTPRVDNIVNDAIRALPTSGRVDLCSDYVHFIPAAVLYALIGIPKAAWRDVQAWSDVLVANILSPPDDYQPEFASLTGYLTRLIEERRADAGHRREDVLDNLCFAEDSEEDVSTAEVVMHIFQLVVAATDTTRALIANCLYRLLEHRKHWEVVVADRSLLPNAIEESLRLDSPAQFMVRTVTENVTVDGCPISAGKKVYLNIQSANHDEKVWGEDSRTYRPDRPNAAGHLAFGRGIHACVGAPLARIEARSAIGALMHAYPNMTLASDARWVKCEGPLIKRVESVPVLLAREAE